VNILKYLKSKLNPPSVKWVSMELGDDVYSARVYTYDDPDNHIKISKGGGFRQPKPVYPTLEDARNDTDRHSNPFWVGSNRLCSFVIRGNTQIVVEFTLKAG
jgi:hypothetical protein